MTPDVNVLVAASRTDHPHHAVALGWLNRALADCATGARFSVLPMVAAGTVRLVTHPRVFASPTPTPDALAFVQAVLDAPGVEIPGLGDEWAAFVDLCQTHALTGNTVPDAWIAAAVRDHHEHLVTFDRGFRRLLPQNRLTVLEPDSAAPDRG
ncbi:MAG: type II toxin-antitoxin system VapC family toxin [Rubricoccaceae bacterium]